MNVVPIQSLRQSANAAKLKTALLQVTSPAADFINADFDYLTADEQKEILNHILDAMAILAPLAYNLRPIVRAAEATKKEKTE